MFSYCVRLRVLSISKSLEFEDVKIITVLVSGFERGRIVALRDVGLCYRKIVRSVNHTAKLIGQRTRTTEGQDKRFGPLTLRDYFAVSPQIADQWFGDLSMFLTPYTINASFDCGPLSSTFELMQRTIALGDRMA